MTSTRAIASAVLDYDEYVEQPAQRLVPKRRYQSVHTYCFRAWALCPRGDVVRGQNMDSGRCRFRPVCAMFAHATLTVTPITWNVVGLDSNSPTAGPKDFPVGARLQQRRDHQRRRQLDLGLGERECQPAPRVAQHDHPAGDRRRRLRGRLLRNRGQSGCRSVRHHAPLSHHRD
jgi:hypothetical protein